MQIIFRTRSTREILHNIPRLPTFTLAVMACAQTQKPVVSEAPTVAPSTFEAVYYGTGAYTDRALFRMVVDVGSRKRELVGRNFTPNDYGMSRSGPLAIPGSGELPVRVALVGPTGDTLATARVALTLHPNWSFDVMALAGGRRPEGMCVGRVTAVPIRPEGIDTLFIMSSGLPNGAMC